LTIKSTSHTSGNQPFSRPTTLRVTS